MVIYLKDILASNSNIIYDDSKRDFYNLSVSKLDEYRFQIEDYKTSLKEWRKIKDER